MSVKSKNRAAKAAEQLALFDAGLEPIHIRIRRFVKENRSAGWREIAAHHGVAVDEVRRSLQPEATVTPGIPCCEAPYCLADGRFVFRKPGWEGLRGPRRYACAVHEAWAVQSLASASV